MNSLDHDQPNLAVRTDNFFPDIKICHLETASALISPIVGALINFDAFCTQKNQIFIAVGLGRMKNRGTEAILLGDGKFRLSTQPFYCQFKRNSCEQSTLATETNGNVFEKILELENQYETSRNFLSS